MFFNCNTGILEITCNDGSKTVLTRGDFPHRDDVACYYKVDGKLEFSHWEVDTPNISVCVEKVGATA